MRPLIVCDCDEVLFDFAVPFAAHLDAMHRMELKFDRFALAGNIRHAESGELVAAEAIPALIDDFFRRGMDRQSAVPGAAAALTRLAGRHDIVILTNIEDAHHAARTSQILAAGMPYEVVCNRGPKGPAVRALAERHGAGDVIFIDDLPPHHESVAKIVPESYRVHMVANPGLRRLIDPAPHAHRRIDEWDELAAHLDERNSNGTRQ